MLIINALIRGIWKTALLGGTLCIMECFIDFSATNKSDNISAFNKSYLGLIAHVLIIPDYRH